MRMKRSRLRTLTIANKVVTKDAEGGPVVSYNNPKEFEGTLWPAGGKLQIQKYGDKVDSMMNCKLKGNYEIIPEGNHVKYDFGGFSLREDDGVFVYTDDKPDYRIVSITAHKPLFMELERL